MKKWYSLLVCILSLSILPACWCCKKPCKPQVTQEEQTKKPKEIGWED